MQFTERVAKANILVIGTDYSNTDYNDSHNIGDAGTKGFKQ